LRDTKEQLSQAQDAKTAAEKKIAQLVNCTDAAHALAAAALAQDDAKGQQAGVNLVLA
jgi:hypothetical protein